MRNLYNLAAADETENAEGILSGESTDGKTEEIITTDGSNGAPGEGAPAREPPPAWMQYAPLIFIAVIMYMLLFRGPRKKQQRQKKMMQSLQRNDRVQTIGGILGTIVDVREDEITLKVDESNNTKIRIFPSAVSKVLNDEVK